VNTNHSRKKTAYEHQQGRGMRAYSLYA
jgi:hypothetical protein